MNKKNDYIREYLGVDKWHAAGYTGKRVNALTGERLEAPCVTEHGKQTAAAFHEIAPDAKLSYAPFPGAGNVVEKFHNLRGDACVMFVSLAVQGGGDREIADGAIPEDLFVCVGAGNYGEDYANGMMLPASAYGVGAVDVRWSAMRGGKPLPGASLLVQSAQYTSHSDHVDFGAATGLYLDGFADTFTGTSCAAPVLAGMAALVNDFFIDKTSHPLPHLSMYRFFKDHAVDIDEKGKDVKVGWGVPRLPDPETIDIWRYQVPEEDETVTFLEAHKSNFTRGREAEIDRIVVHWTAGNNDTALENGCFFAGPNRDASAHYFVDDLGVLQSVKDEDTAWHCGNWEMNSRSIGVEMCTKADENGNHFIGEKTISNAVDFIKELMKKYDIPVAGVVRHYDVNAKRCPEPFVSDQDAWEKFRHRLRNDGQFADVDKSHWFYDSVEYCAENGLMNGDGNGDFRPYDECTRAELATVIARLHKEFCK